jgi:hypothetical protein
MITLRRSCPAMSAEPTDLQLPLSRRTGMSTQARGAGDLP